jgi:hypothetical protein
MARNRRKKQLYDWSCGVTQELGELLRFGAWEQQIPPSTYSRKLLAKAVLEEHVPQRMADPQRLKAYLDWSQKNHALP